MHRTKYLPLLLHTLAAASPELPSPGIDQGRHIVHNVALCADCHTPRLPDGSLDLARPLAGAPIGFVPRASMPWAPVAPPLAGLPGRSDAELVTLLTTGHRADGSAPLPPMPAFKLTLAEAKAVVAYLRSFSSSNPQP